VTDLGPIVERFHTQHAREHNYRRDNAAVEVYRLNVTAIGKVPKPEPPKHKLNGATPTPIAKRPVWFQGEPDAVATPVFDRSTLTAGTVIHGPAIIEQLDSTTPIPPSATLEVDAWLNLRITV
jgi:N-methylhydantoinase A